MSLFSGSKPVENITIFLINNSTYNFYTPADNWIAKRAAYFVINTTSDTNKINIYIDSPYLFSNESFSFFSRINGEINTIHPLIKVIYPISNNSLFNGLTNYNYSTEIFCNGNEQIILKFYSTERIEFSIKTEIITGETNFLPSTSLNNQENNNMKDIDVLEEEDIRNQEINKEEEEKKDKKFLFLCLYGFIASNLDLILLIILLTLLLFFKNKAKKGEN
jgi:hypothetical protein